MTAKRVSVLAVITALSFILLSISAFIPRIKAEKQTFFPSAEGYQSIESEKEEGKVKISGCLSQDELTAIFGESLKGIIEETQIKVADDSLILTGRLASNKEKITERFPNLKDATMLLDIVSGADIFAKMSIVYNENGFEANLTEAKLGELSIPTDIFSSLAEDIKNGLNGKLQNNVNIHYWRLEKGGLYYSVTMDKDGDISIIYPIV